MFPGIIHFQFVFSSLMIFWPSDANLTFDSTKSFGWDHLNGWTDDDPPNELEGVSISNPRRSFANEEPALDSSYYCSPPLDKAVETTDLIVGELAATISSSVLFAINPFSLLISVIHFIRTLFDYICSGYVGMSSNAVANSSLASSVVFESKINCSYSMHLCWISSSQLVLYFSKIGRILEFRFGSTFANLTNEVKINALVLVEAVKKWWYNALN